MAEEEITPDTSETTLNETTARAELSIDEFLQKIDLSTLADLFKEEEVTMDILRTFNDDDLRNIGITKYGPRKKILNSIASLEHKGQKDLEAIPSSTSISSTDVQPTAPPIPEEQSDSLPLHPPTYSEAIGVDKGPSIAVNPDQELKLKNLKDQKELKDLLIDHDILSLHEILSNNSITTNIIWDLEEQQLREMGMNVGDMLIYNKAKNFRKERLFVKLKTDDHRERNRTTTITQGIATKIGNKLWKGTDDTLDYFPEYLNGSHQYQFPNTFAGLQISVLAKSNCDAYVCFGYQSFEEAEKEEKVEMAGRAINELESKNFIRKNGEINRGKWTIHYKKLLKNEEVSFNKPRYGPNVTIFIK